MPRLKDKLPSYRYHNTSGQAYVSLGGHRVYLGKYDSPASREAYGRALAEWMTSGRQSTSAAAGGEVTVAELIAAFWEHAQRQYGGEGAHPGEIGSFRTALRVLRRLYGRTDAKDFGPKALKAVRKAMVDEKWCRNVVNAQVNRVRRAFKWAVAEELVPPALLEGLRAVPGLRRGKGDARESEPVRPVPEPYVAAALARMNRQVAAMVNLQLVTGMRPGEVCGMRGVDIDTAGRLWVYTPAKHKTQHHGHARTIYLGPRAQEVLRPFLKPDLSAYLFSPAAAEAERRAAQAAARKTPLSCGNKPGSNRKAKRKRPPGQLYPVNTYAHAIGHACDKADRWAKGGKVIADTERLIPRWHPHQLRHNAATRLRKELGLEAAQVILGHKTLNVTQIYAEKNVEAAMRIMAEVG